MSEKRGIIATVSADERGQAIASEGKQPRTARGQRTLRAILDAAAAEFGEKGFHDGFFLKPKLPRRFFKKTVVKCSTCSKFLVSCSNLIMRQ